MTDFDPRPIDAVDRKLRAARISRAGRERVLQALHRAGASRPPARWVPALALAAAAAVAVGAWWGVSRTPAEERGPAVAQAVPSGWQLAAGCQHDPLPSGSARLGAGCSLEVAVAHTRTAVDVQVWDAAVVSSRGKGLSLHAGSVTFAVEPVRSTREPIEIGVPFGRIEILGTRFAVRAGPEGGEVSLYEGKIRFTHASGRVQTMQPGERVVWTSAGVTRQAMPSVARAPSDPAAEDARPAPVIASEPPAAPVAPPRVGPRTARAAVEVDLDATLDRIAELRRAGQHQEALRLFDRLERAGLSRRTAEVLSFEKGTLLESIEDPRACPHWDRHARRHPGGRYADAVERRRERCSSSDEDARKR